MTSALRMKRIFKKHGELRTQFPNTDLKPECADTKMQRSAIDLLWSLKKKDTDQIYWVLQHNKYFKPTLVKISELKPIVEAKTAHMAECSIPTCVAGVSCQLCYFNKLSDLGLAGAMGRRDRLMEYRNTGGDVASLAPGYAYAIKVWKS